MKARKFWFQMIALILSFSGVLLITLALGGFDDIACINEPNLYVRIFEVWMGVFCLGILTYMMREKIILFINKNESNSM